ncbi:MAG: hypothetical protein V4683_05160 [Bacteroidota bacterium]
MKINVLQIFFLLFISANLLAQLGIKETNTAPNTKAMLDVESANKGLLIPRMNTATRDGIATPADGLMIYNSQTKKFNYFNNLAWKESTYTEQWNINGANISYTTGLVGIGIANPTRDLVINSGGSPDILLQQGAATGNTSTDGFMLGTNVAFDGEIWNFENGGIRFGTNNTERMRILSNGNVAINTPSISSKLGVAGNVKASGNIKFNAGEINRTSTGNANLLPIAYGQVLASGGLSGSSGNVNSSKISTGVYEIIISGEAITGYTNYFYKVVPQSANPLIATVYPFEPNSTFRVEVFNVGGLNVDGNFSFVVFKH